MSELPEFAMSLWAPWAWAILNAGKDVENRSMGNFPRSVLGRVWLHASLWPGGRLPLNPNKQHELADEFRAAIERSGRPREDFGVVTFGELDTMRGKIVGSVEVTGYAERSDSRWYVEGSLAVLVRNPVKLAQPVTASGALGWWRVPADVLGHLGEAA